MSNFYTLQPNPHTGGIEIVETDQDGFVLSSQDVTDLATKLVLDKLFQEYEIDPDDGVLEIKREAPST